MDTANLTAALTDHNARVPAPTLLIVGSVDAVVIGLNEQAYEQRRCARQLVICARCEPSLRRARSLEEGCLVGQRVARTLLGEARGRRSQNVQGP